MDLKKLYGQIVVKRAEASVDLTAISPKIRPGIEGMKRQAEVEIVKLEQTYRDEVVKSMVVIAVTGTGAKKFAEIARDKYKTVSVNYFKILDNIVESVVVKRGGRNLYATNEHIMVLDELLKAKMAYGISYMPTLQTRFNEIGVDQPLKESLYKNFSHHYGGSLYSAVLRWEIAQQALENGFTATNLPTVVYNYDVETGLDKTIMNQPVATISVTEEEVTDKLVKENLTEVRDSLKKSK